MDAANSEMYGSKKKKYVFHKSDGKEMSSEEMVEYLGNWVNNILSFQLKMEWQKMIGMAGKC